KANQAVIDQVIRRFERLCQDRSLRSVRISGRASTLMSVEPTNEELARRRAENVRYALVAAWPPSCKKLVDPDPDHRIHIDENASRATTQFGRTGIDYSSNQCAQIHIQHHRCQL